MADMAERIAGKWRIVETPSGTSSILISAAQPSSRPMLRARKNGLRGLEAALECGFTACASTLNGIEQTKGDQVCGHGWADLRDDGCLEGEIAYHNGDETTFIAAP